MKDCLFCKIVKKEIPADIVYENENLLVFKDINPQAPVHVLAIPKRHIDSLNHVSTENQVLVGEIFSKIPEVAKKLEIDMTGYRVISNCGEDGLQTVPHLHFHILGKRKLRWPPG